MIDADMTVGELIALNMLAGRLAPPMLCVVQPWHELQQSRLSIQRLGGVLNGAPESACDPWRPAPGRHADVRRIAQGCSVSDVACHLPAVQEADHSIGIEGRRLAEDGSHEELIRTGGRYAALHGLLAGCHELGWAAASQNRSATPGGRHSAAGAA
jgi:ABC-type bacteriocin/lantibiotic exporter with double-glycine peptidase domain